MKTIYVTYDRNEPELMEKLEEHWRASAFCKRKQTLDAIVREWKAGNTRLLIMPEVVECLKKECQSQSD